jgi:glucose/arabinose dehydrogenase
LLKCARRLGSLLAGCGILLGVPGSALAVNSTDELRAPAGPEVGLELVAEGLTSPVFLTESPDDSGRIFIVDQAGQIRILNDEGTLEDDPFLDLTDKMVELTPAYDERGLLGLAFHPDFTDNGRLFAYYSVPLRDGAPEGWNHTGRVSEFTVSEDDENRVDPESERVVMEIDKPQFNHNGGHIAFGPDGFLYIPMGDGGRANDVGLGHNPGGNAQDLSNVLGTIMRIDVNGPEPYAVPPDNPFVGRANAKPEIWAYGFRNPYHISFDQKGDRELFAADAGQDRFEDVSIITKGGNYGWNIKESAHCFDPERPSQPPATCPSTGRNGEPLIDPVIEYGRLEILSSTVVGGYVYRGTELPELEGSYVFGDYSRDRVRPDGTLFVARRAESGLWPLEEIRPFLPEKDIEGTLGQFVLGFGQSNDGEMYLLSKDEGGPEGDTGTVYRLVPKESARAAGDTDDGEESGGGGVSPWIWLIGALVLIGLAILLGARRSSSNSPPGDSSGT